MAGSQGSALAIAVSNAGGLGSLPCAMLAPDGIRKELHAIAAATSKPYNVNFFVSHDSRPRTARGKRPGASCSHPTSPRYGIDPAAIADGPARMPFNDAAADVLEEFKPPVVSFHFGLPSAELMSAREEVGLEDPLVGDHGGGGAVSRSARRRCGDRAGLRSRRPSRHVPVGRPQHPGRHIRAGSTGRAGGEHPGDCGRRHRRCAGCRGGNGARRRRRPGWDRLSVLSGSDDESAASRGAEERRRAYSRP